MTEHFLSKIGLDDYIIRPKYVPYTSIHISRVCV